MKTNLKTLITAAFLVAAGITAQESSAQASASAQFTSGSDYAATLAARELLKTIYAVPDEKITTTVGQSQGNSVTVNATLPGYSCIMELMKNESANKYGWIVQNPGCRKL